MVAHCISRCIMVFIALALCFPVVILVRSVPLLSLFFSYSFSKSKIGGGMRWAGALGRIPTTSSRRVMAASSTRGGLVAPGCPHITEGALVEA